MKFSFNINKVIQVLGVSAVVIPQYVDIIPNAQWKARVSSAAVVATAIAGLLAHFKNPDGSPVEVPFNPSVPKMPIDVNHKGE